MHTFSSLLSTDRIKIQFPKIYSLDVASLSTVCNSTTLALVSNSSNLNTLNYSCTLSKNVLNLSNLFLSSQGPLSVLSIKINLTNPSTSPTENFIIWS